MERFGGCLRRALAGDGDGAAGVALITSLRELLAPDCPPERGSVLETSLMMRLRPDLVKLPLLDQPDYGMAGISGPPPQAAASPQRGREWFDLAVDILAAMVADARAGNPVRPAWYYGHLHRLKEP